jgi:hypothetical protein
MNHTRQKYYFADIFRLFRNASDVRLATFSYIGCHVCGVKTATGRISAHSRELGVIKTGIIGRL